MTRNSTQSKSARACTLMLVEKPPKPCLDPGSPLSLLRKGTVVDTRIPAQVMTEAGESITGTIIELSGTGLQLATSRQMTDCLQTGFFGFIRCKPETVQLCFSLPSNLEPFDNVRVQCVTLCVRKTARSTARVSMKYLGFSEGEETLAEYLLFKEVIG